MSWDGDWELKAHFPTFQMGNLNETLCPNFYES